MSIGQNVPYQIKKSQTPHVYWIELFGDEMLHECAVLKRDNHNTLFYIKINELDRVDKNRLSRIVNHPHAQQFALSDLMAQQTLQNGVNALQYFHQFVKLLAPNGTIHDPRIGSLAVTGQQSVKKAAPAKKSA